MERERAVGDTIEAVGRLQRVYLKSKDLISQNIM